MRARPKILLLDDDSDLLELYREIIERLPSQPEVHTATSGARAIALLESEPFTLLLSDLSMPKMDGLQVLAIVRRKFPQLRTAVLTGILDEQFRARAYAIGVDIYLEKPGTPQEIKLFTECIESLLGQETQSGFRGVQSKSLVDIIQLECLSQSSSVLKITNGVREGKIWFQHGEVIDAETQDLTGEAAFERILGWQTGNFEILSGSQERPRAIFKSYQALLLESAQALDESQAQQAAQVLGVLTQPAALSVESPLATMAHVSGVEFVLCARGLPPKQIESWGVENREPLATWMGQTLGFFRTLGEQLQAGPLARIEGLGPQRHVALVGQTDKELCVGFQRSLTPDQIRTNMKSILAAWLL